MRRSRFVSPLSRRLGSFRLHRHRSVAAVAAILVAGALVASCGGPSNAPAGATSPSPSKSPTQSKPKQNKPANHQQNPVPGSAAGGWQIPASAKKYISDDKQLNQTDTTKTCHSGALQLSFWSWVPGLNRAVNLYNLTHPKVCVKWVNTAGYAGSQEEVKLRAAMKAGSGVPDVFHDAQSAASNWILTKDVANLVPYGANKVKSDFVNWVWNIVAPFGGSAVYAIPWDSGPMGLLYNAAAFKKYGLAVPTTWKQFAQEAESLHKAHPGMYMANFNGLPIEQLLWWQTGAYPIKWDGTSKLVMNYDLPQGRKAAQYWQKLWSDKALANVAGNASYKALASGQVLTQFAAAWYPDVFTTPGKTKGDWRVAKLPQWTAGADTYPNDGGSALFVSTASKHPQEATDFAIWLMTSQASWYVMVRPPILLFPTVTSVLGNKQYLSQTIPLTGPQQLWKVYAHIAAHVKTNWQFSPIEPQVATVISDEMKTVYARKATLPSILPKIQAKLTSQAQTAGFTVSTS